MTSQSDIDLDRQPHQGIASTHPKHQIYGFNTITDFQSRPHSFKTTQTLQPTKKNAADLNFLKLRKQAASIFTL